MTYLAITVLGHDRPGIIAQAAEALARCGMNLEDAQMTLLRGHFAMTRYLRRIGLRRGDRVRPGGAGGRLVDGGRPRAAAGERRTGHADEHDLVTVHGADRLGIVARLAGAVAAAGGNITDLTTRLTGELYVLIAEVDLAPEVADRLEADLLAAAAELGVGVTLRQVERDEL